MRESVGLNLKNETPKERMQRMKRNRLIRKEKLYGKAFQLQQSKSTSTFDDKAHTQKLKNRQAAQKSREQKKQYVTRLEDQIKQLKRVIANLRYCQHCHRELQIQEEYHENHSVQNSQIQESTNLREEELYNEESQSQFRRISSTEQNSSIGIYLFIFMICLGIFCMGTRVDSDPLRRDLTQFTNIPLNTEENSLASVDYAYEQNMRSTYSTSESIDTDTSKFKNGLLSMDQVKSPSSISDEKYFQKIIKSYEIYKFDTYSDKNLRSKVSYIDGNKSLMFCSGPKIYKSSSKSQDLVTPWIDIFVNQAQIINLFPHLQASAQGAKSFNLDGLFKITANIVEIEQVINPNIAY